jgi:hypothetical protein
MLDAEKYDGSLLNNVTSLFGGGMATQSALSTGLTAPSPGAEPSSCGPTNGRRERLLVEV